MWVVPSTEISAAVSFLEHSFKWFFSIKNPSILLTISYNGDSNSLLLEQSFSFPSVLAYLSFSFIFSLHPKSLLKFVLLSATSNGTERGLLNQLKPHSCNSRAHDVWCPSSHILWVRQHSFTMFSYSDIIHLFTTLLKACCSCSCMSHSLGRIHLTVLDV